MSRSVRLLSMSSIPPSVVPPLMALLQDNDAPDAQVAAAGAVCNLLLSFSSIRSALIQADVLQTLAPLTQSMLPDLRLHAVWAFKNLANDCEDKVQSQLLSELSWSTFTALLVGDDDPRVREQAVALLQNLCKGGHSIPQASRR
eukprot:gene6830-7048_t